MLAREGVSKFGNALRNLFSLSMIMLKQNGASMQVKQQKLEISHFNCLLA